MPDPASRPHPGMMPRRQQHHPAAAPQPATAMPRVPERAADPVVAERTEHGSAARGARAILAGKDGAHPGLLLACGMGEPESGSGTALAQRVVAAWPRARSAYQRYYEALAAGLTAAGAVHRSFVTLSPLAVGLGNSSPLENGLTLLAATGAPWIPGDALKNAARRGAAELGGDAILTETAYQEVFGSSQSAGRIEFWGAWPDPNTPSVLQVDVMTPHHQSYYASGGAVAPTDFDDPNPVSFLSVPPGVTFHAWLGCADNGLWSDAVAGWLAHALTWQGTGAKTRSGYGRLTQPPG